MPKPTMAELQKELVELKIRVNNIEKKMFCTNSKTKTSKSKIYLD